MTDDEVKQQLMDIEFKVGAFRKAYLDKADDGTISQAAKDRCDELKALVDALDAAVSP